MALAPTRFVLFVVTDGSDQRFSDTAVKAIGDNPNVSILDCKEVGFVRPYFLQGTPTLYDQATWHAFRGEYAIKYLEKMQQGMMEVLPAPVMTPSTPLPYGARTTIAPTTTVSSVRPQPPPAAWTPSSAYAPTNVASRPGPAVPAVGKDKRPLGAKACATIAKINGVEEDDSCVVQRKDGSWDFVAKHEGQHKRKSG